MAEKKEKKEKKAKAPKEPKPTPKYQALTANFFKGSTAGQINSVYKTRETNPEKVAEFKKAITDKDVVLTGPLTKSMVKKLVEMGITVAKDLMPVE